MEPYLTKKTFLEENLCFSATKSYNKPYDFNEIDMYVNMIVKDKSNDLSLYKTIDMEEIDKYVETILKDNIIYVEQNEIDKIERKPNIIQYNSYKKNNTTNCIIQ